MLTTTCREITEARRLLSALNEAFKGTVRLHKQLSTPNKHLPHAEPLLYLTHFHRRCPGNTNSERRDAQRSRFSRRLWPNSRWLDVCVCVCDLSHTDSPVFLTSVLKRVIHSCRRACKQMLMKYSGPFGVWGRDDTAGERMCARYRVIEVHWSL